MKDIQFSSFGAFSKNMVFIDGITRSGKFWMGNLMSHMENVDHFRHEPAFDTVSTIFHLGGMTEDAAVLLLQNMANQHVYQNMVGRNLNCKAEDSSSIYRNPNVQEYLLRMASPIGSQQEIVQGLQESGRIFPIVAHDWLSHLGPHFKAFPGMKLVRMERSPLDLAYGWYSTGLANGRMFFSDRIDSTTGGMPWFCHEWADEFDDLSPVERIIKSILYLYHSAQEVYEKLGSAQRADILFTSYEGLAHQPAVEAERIASFMGTEVSVTLDAYIASPAFIKRSLKSIRDKRNEKLVELSQSASSELIEELSVVQNGYDDLSPGWG